MNRRHRTTLAALCVLLTAAFWLTGRRHPGAMDDKAVRSDKAEVSPPGSRAEAPAEFVVLPHADATVLASRDVVNPENPRLLRREKLVRSDFKYPLLRLEQTVERDAAGVETTQGQVAMVADHVVVKVRPGQDETSLLEAFLPLKAVVRRKMPVSGLWLVGVEGEAGLDTVKELVAAGKNRGLALYAEPDYLQYAMGMPNDPRFGELYGMNNTGQTGGSSDADIDAPEAWDLHTGSAKVVVGVLDTGIDYNHPDLAANIWSNAAEANGLAGVDDDGNGLVDDVRGYDFANDDTDPMDGHQHGTHCAGTIGAVGGNGVGVTGVCWTVRLMPLKFLSDTGVGVASDAVEAVVYATQKGVTLTSNSWGGAPFNQALQDAIQAAGDAGILFVTSAGNDGRDIDTTAHYPSSYAGANIISVANVTHLGALNSLSNYGSKTVHLAAPGTNILSAVPGNGYAQMTGSSMAASHVSGACALLKSYRPALTGADVRRLILAGVDYVSGLQTKVATGGPLNVWRSLNLAAGLYLEPGGTQFQGKAGGPFLPSSLTWRLRNHDNREVGWQVSGVPAWLSLNWQEGRLGAGLAADLNLTLTAAAATLPAGTATATLRFLNITSGVSLTRNVTLAMDLPASLPFSETWDGAAPGPWWRSTGSGSWRNRIVATNGPRAGNHLIMDSSQSAATTLSRNEMTLTVDLADWRNVVLQFWAKSFNDEPHGPPASPFQGGADFDGVAVSADGIQWREVQSLRSLSSQYTRLTVDLDAAVAALGLAYNDTFRIRFNHADKNSAPANGIAIEDITLTGFQKSGLGLTLPASVAEGGSVQGMATVSPPQSGPVTVFLEMPPGEGLTAPASVVIPAGAGGAPFTLSAAQNTTLDGPRVVSVGFSGPAEFARRSVALTLTEDETSVLQLTGSTTVTEGGQPAVSWKVLSSVAPARDVTVALLSDNPRLTTPASVELPAGAREVAVPALAPQNGEIDGPATALLQASVADWTPAELTVTVADDEDNRLTVTTPATALEGDGWVSGGRVSIPSPSTANLSVTLVSENAAQISVSSPVIIWAGQTSAAFSLFMGNDSLVNGTRQILITASANMVSASAATRLVDDDSPPRPYGPTPEHLSTQNSLQTDLAWQFAQAEHLENGGFEQGLGGWSFSHPGAVRLAERLFDPEGPEPPSTPPEGLNALVLLGNTPGVRTVSRELTVPENGPARLTWRHRLRNQGAAYSDSRSFRLHLEDMAGARLGTLWSTNYTTTRLDVWSSKWTVWLTPWRGQRVRLVFEMTNDAGPMHAWLDAVSLPGTAISAPTGYEVAFGSAEPLGPENLLGTTSARSFSLPELEADRQYFWQVTAFQGSARTPGPVWRFRTSPVGGLDHFRFREIGQPQAVNTPFEVSLTAEDGAGNALSVINGPLTVAVENLDGGAPLDLPQGGNITLTGGVWTGNLAVGRNITDAARLVVDDGQGHRGASNSFAVRAARALTVQVTDPVFTEGEGTRAAAGVITLQAAQATAVTIGISSLPAKFGPQSVTIPAGQVSAGFSLTVLDDALLDGSQPVGLLFSGPDYLPLTATVTVHDNENGLPTLRAAPFFTEGDGLVENALTLELATPAGRNVVVELLSSDTTELRLPASVTVPQGSASVRIPLTIQDDSLLDWDQVVVISARVTNWTTATTVTTVRDNDAVNPALTLTLPADYLEGSGSHPNAGRVALSATAVTPMTVFLASDHPGKLGLPGSVTVPAGAAEAWFDLTALDDGLQDGSKTVTITATAEFFSPASAAMVIRDDEPHHFAVEPLLAAGAPAYLGRPFGVRVRAEAVDGTLVEDFAGAVALAGMEAGQPVAVTPASVTLAAGQWTGNVTSPALSAGLELRATAGAVSGTSRLISVLRGAVIAVDPVALSVSTAQETTKTRTLTITNTGNVPLEWTGETTATGPTRLAPAAGSVAAGASQTVTLTLAPVITPLGAYSDTVRILSNDGLAPVTVVSLSGTVTSSVYSFVFDPVTSPQYMQGGFPVRITAVDAGGQVVTDHREPVTLTTTTMAASGQRMVGGSTTTLSYPFHLSHHDSRSQMIYTQAELGGPGSISALAFNLTTTQAQFMNGFTIRMKSTTKADYSGGGGWENTGWTVVHQSYASIPVTGWKEFVFSTPFTYDGVSNLMVDVSYDNYFYTEVALVGAYAAGSNRMLTYNTDSASGNPLTWSGVSPPPLASAILPQLRLTVSGLPLVISPGQSGEFVNGVWSGNVQIHQGSPVNRILARDSQGRTGTSGAFAVLSSGSLAFQALVPLLEGSSSAAGFRVSTSSPVATNLTISITNQDPTRLQCPATAVISAGNTYVDVPASTPDNAALEGPAEARLLLSAPGYSPVAGSVMVTDNETTGVSLSFPSVVLENTAFLATLSTNDAYAADRVFDLSTATPGLLTTPPTVTLPAGRKTVTFTVSAPDNGYLDPDSILLLRASYLQGPVAEASVKLTDDEPSVISLGYETPGTYFEGGGFRVVARLGGLARAGMTLNLASDHPTLTVSATTTTIAKDSASAMFSVNVAQNTAKGPNPVATVTASFPGLTAGTLRVAAADDETDRFTLTPAANSVQEGFPLTYTIRSVNHSGLPLAGFSQTVSLSARDAAGGVLTQNPTQTYLSQGLSSVSVRFSRAGTGVVLSAATSLVSGSAPPVTVTMGPRLQISPVTPAVEVRQRETAVRSITLTNTGLEQLSWSLPVPTQNSVILASPASGLLNAGASVVVGLTVSPGSLAPGQRSTTLVFQQNNPVIPTVSFPVEYLVKAPALSLAWDPVGPQWAESSFPVRLRSVNDLGTFEPLDAQVFFHAMQPGVESEMTIAGVPTATGGDQAFPGQGRRQSRLQTIYRAAAIGRSGAIASISLRTQSGGAASGPAFATVRMRHTTLNAWTAPVWEGGWSVVYEGPVYAPASGVVTLPLKRAFDYDGVSNLMVDYSYDLPAGNPISLFLRDVTAAAGSTVYFSSTSAQAVPPRQWSGAAPAGALLALQPQLAVRISGTHRAVTPSSASLSQGEWAGALRVMGSGAAHTLRAEVWESDNPLEGTSAPFMLHPPGSITISSVAPLVEGGTGEITATLNPPAFQETTLSLASLNPARLTLPASVTVPAGQASVTVAVTLPDNADYEPAPSAQVTAEAPGYARRTVALPVRDNEIPQVSLLLPAQLAEGGSGQGTLTVSPAYTEALVFTLASDTTSLVLPATLTIPAGQTSQNFTLTYPNDSLVNRPAARVTASHASLPGAARTLPLVDNETRSLSVAAGPAALEEGAGGVLTITATVLADFPATFSLASSLPDLALAAPAITLPANSLTASVNFTALQDSLTQGSRSAVVTLTPDAATPGTVAPLPVNILDDDLHHLAVAPQPAVGILAFGRTQNFGVTALTVDNRLLLNFAQNLSTAELRLADGSLIPLPGQADRAFQNGALQLPFRPETPGPGQRLVVRVGSVVSESDDFEVAQPTVAGFAWSGLPPAVDAAAPATATLSALDALGRPFVSGPNVTLNLSQQALSAASVGGAGSVALSTAWYSQAARFRGIYPPTNLGGSRPLHRLEFQLTGLTGVRELRNLTLRLGHTSTSSHSGETWASPAGLALQTMRTRSLMAVNGRVGLDFTTPFNYSSVFNLVVDISFELPSGNGAVGILCYAPTSPGRLLWLDSPSPFPPPADWDAADTWGGMESPRITNLLPVLRLFAPSGPSVPADPASVTLVNGTWTGNPRLVKSGDATLLRVTDSAGGGWPSPSMAYVNGVLTLRGSAHVFLGGSHTLTLVLNRPNTTAYTVNLGTDPPLPASWGLPAQITLPAGQTEAAFTFQTPHAPDFYFFGNLLTLAATHPSLATATIALVPHDGNFPDLTDEDRDGVPADLEVILGRSATVAEPQPPLTPDSSARWFQFDRLSGVEPWKVLLQTSPDLKTWTTAPAASLQITPLPGGLRERVTYPFPPGPVRVYSRLRLETGP